LLGFVVFSALSGRAAGQPHNSLRSPNRLDRLPALTRLRLLKDQHYGDDFTGIAPGCGLSGSADLASEASYEADRSGHNPTRQTTTSPNLK